VEIRIHKTRLIFVFLFFLSLLVLLLFRLFYIQIGKSLGFERIAKSQHEVMIHLEPRRGTIYDRNMSILAVNLDVSSVFAAPRMIDKDKKPRTARRLAHILDKSEDKILERLNRDKGFIWIARKVPEEKARAIRALELTGIELQEESKRFYPNGHLASHVIGFAGLDNTGLEGIELLFDKYLKGKPGVRLTQRDGKKRYIPSRDEDYLPPIDGFDIILNIDEAIQNITEQALDDVYDKYTAKGATAVVMNPHTGEILAIANRPSYDLNSFSEAKTDVRRNRAITDIFEPGSVFKIVTASLVLEKGLVGLKDRFFCENGKYWIGGRILHDHRPHAILTFKEVIEKSSNIGTVKVAQKLKPKDLYNYIRALGFGKITGIDLPGEVTGLMYSPKNWSKTSISALPIGHEITVTAMQLACSMSVIANGGILVKPWVVKEIRDTQGEVILDFQPQVVRRVIREDTAKQTRRLLAGVVENGTGKRARLNSYSSGGKTGTAQKIEPAGVYSHSKFLASFIGFAPVEEPRIVVVVCVDEPRPVYYGGVVSAPVFKEVAENTLKYLGVDSDISDSKGRRVVYNAR